jgi:hypothetical protein
MNHCFFLLLLVYSSPTAYVIEIQYILRHSKLTVSDLSDSIVAVLELPRAVSPLGCSRRQAYRCSLLLLHVRLLIVLGLTLLKE